MPQNPLINYLNGVRFFTRHTGVLADEVWLENTNYNAVDVEYVLEYYYQGQFHWDDIRRARIGGWKSPMSAENSFYVGYINPFHEILSQYKYGILRVFAVADTPSPPSGPTPTPTPTPSPRPTPTPSPTPPPSGGGSSGGSAGMSAARFGEPDYGYLQWEGNNLVYRLTNRFGKQVSAIVENARHGRVGPGYLNGKPKPGVPPTVQPMNWDPLSRKGHGTIIDLRPPIPMGMSQHMEINKEIPIPPKPGAATASASTPAPAPPRLQPIRPVPYGQPLPPPRKG